MNSSVNGKTTVSIARKERPAQLCRKCLSAEKNAAVSARECLDVVMVKISIKRAVMILSKKSLHVYIFATNAKSIADQDEHIKKA